MNPKENRQEKRFSVEDLPSSLQSLTVFIHGEEIEAWVVNASRSGFGFRIKLFSQHFIQGTTIALLFSQLKHRLSAEIVFVEPSDDGWCRVGVRLNSSLGYDYYLEALKDF